MNAQNTLVSNKRIPTLIPVTLADYPTVQNMARFYVYEMSRECGLNSIDWACPADGLYECFDFKHYFVDPDRKAFLAENHSISRR